jgi:uncharacterized membrane protein (UPF0127 family)
MRSGLSEERKQKLKRIATRIAIGGLVITSLGAVLFGAGAAIIRYRLSDLSILGPMPDCRPDVLHIGGTWGQVDLLVELADTPEERAQGLMFRTSLPASSGMLFVYEEPGSPAFWMKNTLIPLDMLFFDARGDLRHVHFGAVPHDETPIPGGDGIQFVLEVAAGEVARLGIGSRSTMRHPSIDPDTARWGC